MYESTMMDVPDIPSHRAPVLPYVTEKDIVDRVSARADVPCGKCQLCCKTLIVPLAHEEYKQYDWVWVTTLEGKQLGRALKRRANGDCVYLGENGCTIHGRAPHVCQRFDCRELFQKSDRAGRRQAIKSGKIPKALFNKGREMLSK
jgi:hypothetical protein